MAYVLTGQRSGAVRFWPSDSTVTAENAQYKSRPTQYPIEDGSVISDHVIKDPEQFAISGAIVGGPGTIAQLTAMRDSRDILSYMGRAMMDSLVITSLSFDYKAQNRDGASFKAQLQRVQITSAVWVETGAVPLMSAQDGRNSSAGRSRTKNAGQQGAAWVSARDNGTTTTQVHLGDKPPTSPGPSDRATGAYNGMAAK